MIAVGEGGVRVADGGDSEAAGRVKSRADVGQVDPDNMVTGRASVDESSEVMRGKAVSEKGGSRDDGGGDVGAAVMAAG